MGAVLLVQTGCRKSEERSENPAAPASYVHDKVFMGKLSAERARHSELMRERNAIADKMQKMVEAKKAELKTEDLAKVKAELDRDPAWQALYAACTNANARVERHRRETFGKVRDRLRGNGDGKAAAPKEISK